MNRCIRLVVLAGLFSGSRAAAQANRNAAWSITEPNPKDVASADAIIAALYDANTVMVDQKLETDRFRSLFIDGARLMPTVRLGNNPGIIRVQSVDDYVNQASAGNKRHGFSEREIARTSEAFGNIMQVFSTYETKRDSADTRPIHGINSIQLFNNGTRWFIVSVLWDNERLPEKQIPAVFMRNSTSP